MNPNVSVWIFRIQLWNIPFIDQLPNFFKKKTSKILTFLYCMKLGTVLQNPSALDEEKNIKHPSFRSLKLSYLYNEAIHQARYMHSTHLKLPSVGQIRMYKCTTISDKMWVCRNKAGENFRVAAWRSVRRLTRNSLDMEGGWWGFFPGHAWGVTVSEVSGQRRRNVGEARSSPGHARGRSRGNFRPSAPRREEGPPKF